VNKRAPNLYVSNRLVEVFFWGGGGMGLDSNSRREVGGRETDGIR